MMKNNVCFYKDKRFVLKIPSTIISSAELSFNEKLILGVDFTFQAKKGYNGLTNLKIGELLSLHVNIVSYCRKNLVEKGFILKQKTKYILTEKHQQFETEDRRQIYLPYQIYGHKDLATGAKLLWGEYNSISRGTKEYFAKRSFTSKRLNASEESITNWTKQLMEYRLLNKYEHRKGYCTSQKVIITCKFKNGIKI